MIRASTLMALVPLVACTGGDGGKKKTSTDNGLTTTRYSATTNNQGVAELEIEVDDSVDVFSVYAEGDYYLSVEAVRNPNNERVLKWQDWTDDLSLTGAVFVEGNNTILNWPIREEDGELDSGTWLVEVSAVDNDYFYVGDAAIDVVVQTRAESDGFTEATIAAEIVYAGTIGNNADVVEATEAAVARWEEIWGAYGITLDASYRNAPGVDESVPDLEGDSSVILSQSGEGNNRDILVLIGESIGNYRDVYGIAGGIPCTPVESPRSAVVISWLTNAGADGIFSEDDIRLYGETLAHEVGHYTGLFHPVEDGWQYYDAISDTEDCANTSACENSLGDNLMFPYPVCGFNDCTPQDQLSAIQQGVMQRYIGAL